MWSCVGLCNGWRSHTFKHARRHSPQANCLFDYRSLQPLLPPIKRWGPLPVLEMTFIAKRILIFLYLFKVSVAVMHISFEHRFACWHLNCWLPVGSSFPCILLLACASANTRLDITCVTCDIVKGGVDSSFRFFFPSHDLLWLLSYN